MNLAVNLSKAIAVALILWCAGAGCTMVSYARVEGSTSDVRETIAGAHASINAHACCKARHKPEMRATPKVRKIESSNLTRVAPPEDAMPSDVMSCCPLRSGSIVIASRAQSTHDRATLNHTGSSSLHLTKSNLPTLAVPLRPSNRARAYLLDCAFLI